MSDATSIIQASGSIFAMCMAVYAIHRSSRQKTEDAVKSLQDTLNKHILEESKDVIKMQADIQYIKDNVSSKLDLILKALSDETK
jgi:hypothetical protein